MSALTEKYIFITGASHGIGKSIAYKFAASGWNLALNCCKSKKEICEIKTDIEKRYSVTCQIFLGDIGDYIDAEKIFNKMQSLGIIPDAVVNNAGIAHIGLLSDMTIEEWNEVIQTNLTSLFNTSKFIVPMMVRKQRGRILNISSVWGITGASCETAYSASKGAVNAFTKALAKELAPSNIQVNAIACGAIDTRMNDGLDLESLQCLKDEIPAGRLGTGDEVADLAFQVINANDYLTAQIITLDGGWT